MERNDTPMIFKPATGTVLAIAAGFSFYMLCMAMPLVGPTGSRVEDAAKNEATFVSVLVLTLALAAASAYSRYGRRKLDGGPLPWYSLGLCAVCVIMLVVLLFHGFAI